MLNELERRLAEQQRTVAYSDKRLRRHAIARSRGEPTAIAISAEADQARAAASAETAALKTAIIEAKAGLAQAQANEQAASAREANRQFQADADAVIDLDLEIADLFAKLRDALFERAQRLENLRVTDSQLELMDVLGDILHGVQIRQVQAAPLADAISRFVLADCKLLGRSPPPDLAPVVPTIVERIIARDHDGFPQGRVVKRR
jgi:hypothetical protein